MPGNDVRPHPMPEKIRANRSVGERLSRESTHNQNIIFATYRSCLLYTSDAADE